MNELQNSCRTWCFGSVLQSSVSLSFRERQRTQVKTDAGPNGPRGAVERRRSPMDSRSGAVTVTASYETASSVSGSTPDRASEPVGIPGLSPVPSRRRSSKEANWSSRPHPTPRRSGRGWNGGAIPRHRNVQQERPRLLVLDALGPC